MPESLATYLTGPSIPPPLAAAQLRVRCYESPWWNVLIQPEEVFGIIVRLDRYHALPSFVISLRHAVLFVAAHEVYVNPRFHSGPKFVEDSANPGNIAGVSGWLRPVRQQIQDERSAAITECGLVRSDPCRRATKIGKFNLRFR